MIGQWKKIKSGQIDIYDFVFHKEVRYGSYNSPPIQSVVVDIKKEKDPGYHPEYHETISFLFVDSNYINLEKRSKSKNPKDVRLVDLVMTPEDFLRARDKHLISINADYYIKSHINSSIGRVLINLGVNIEHWYKQAQDEGVFFDCQPHPFLLLEHNYLAK